MSALSAKNGRRMPTNDAYRPETIHTRLGPLFFDPATPARFPSFETRFRNDRWAARVGLDALDDAEWIAHFGRFEPLPDGLGEPLALRYHGHQFRHYNPDLGDGRGFLFAQLRDDAGRLLDLGTKGSGTTPYSRSADGRLTLKGAVREILATELLEALGVETSKTFSVIETGERLTRHDEPSPTRSAVLVRLNHSHIRIGTFQRLVATGEKEAVGRLIDHCIEHYFPEADAAEDRTAALYRRVVAAVATMGAQWMAAGFVHGVLNTDNINVTGESFDYGPWRFLPSHQPGFTAAYFDEYGLYAFGRQPEALQWNLARLAECLLEHASRSTLEAALSSFKDAFNLELARATLARLGRRPSGDGTTDIDVVAAMFNGLRLSEAPFERAFFDLARGDVGAYGGSEWSELHRRLADLERTVEPDRLDWPDAPETLLIDEVEALWSAIADHDDWAALDAKIQRIRDYGAVQSALQGRG